MLYGMSKEQLLSYLNEGRKRAFTLEDVSGDEIKVSLLKKIDDIFKRGLSFYLDFSPIESVTAQSGYSALIFETI